MPKKTKSLTKTQIIATLAENNEMSKAEVKAFLESLCDLAYKEAVAAENGFTIPGLGKLILAHRKARKGRNPATGEEIDIPAKDVLKFRLAKAAKDACG